MCQHVAPFERDRAAEFVIGQDPALHPVVDRAGFLFQPLGNLYFGEEFITRSCWQHRYSRRFMTHGEMRTSKAYFSQLFGRTLMPIWYALDICVNLRKNIRWLFSV